jgi:hypothetical protein
VILALLIMFNKGGVYSFFSLNTLISSVITHHILLILYIVVAIPISLFAILRKWSVIPVIGLLINLYLMTELGITNWLRFLIWLVIGLAIYFSYGYRKSKLRTTKSSSND